MNDNQDMRIKSLRISCMNFIPSIIIMSVSGKRLIARKKESITNKEIKHDNASSFGRIVLFHVKHCKFLMPNKPIKISKAQEIALENNSSTTQPNDRYFATLDRSTVYFSSINQYLSKGYQSLHHTREYSRVAIQENWLALGDISGRIIIYNLSNEKIPPSSTYHWHANKVLSLCFSNDSQLLLSGGYEGVLVIWKLIDGRKNFLTNFESSIQQIERSPSNYVEFFIALGNNSIVSANIVTMKIKTIVSCVQTFPHQSLRKNQNHLGDMVAPIYESTDEDFSSSKSNMQSDEIQSTPKFLLMLAEKNRVQLVDWRKWKTIALIQVAPISMSSHIPPIRTYTTETKTTKIQQLNNFGLCGFVIGGDEGDQMLTVDTDACLYRSTNVNNEFCKPISLRFWERGTTSKLKHRFKLVSTIKYAHVGDVTGAAFSSKDLMGHILCASVSIDGSFKIWRKSEKYARKTSWYLYFSGSFKAEQLLACCFSKDGSILLTGSSSGKISYWDSINNFFLSSIDYPTKSPISRLDRAGSSTTNSEEVAIGVAICEIFCFDLQHSEIRWVCNLATPAQFVVDFEKVYARSEKVIVSASKRNKNSKPFIFSLDVATGIISKDSPCFSLSKDRVCVALMPFSRGSSQRPLNNSRR
jgi:WD40 repeat protein